MARRLDRGFQAASTLVVGPLIFLAVSLPPLSGCQGGTANRAVGTSTEGVGEGSTRRQAEALGADTLEAEPLSRWLADWMLGTRSEVETPPACSHVPGVCRVALQPLGKVQGALLELVAERVTDFYGVDVRVLPEVPLPEVAWYEPRERWRAERLLDFLDPLLPSDCDRILGVTTDDISTTKGEYEDWGILGLANLPGYSAVISSYRTRRHVDEVTPEERLVRVALHELGHTFGLRHCPTTGCYLESAGGTVETIDRETFLCEQCRARIPWREY